MKLLRKRNWVRPVLAVGTVLLLTMLVFALATPAAFAQDGEPFPSNVVTATTRFNVNLRTGPGLTFDIITTVPQGTVVGFTGFVDATGNWVQVDPAGGTPVGWIFASLLSNVPDDLEVRPAELVPFVVAADQDVGGDNAVTVPEVVAAQPGWIVIHADNNGAPGAVIGHAAVPAGINEDVVVTIDMKMATETLYAMLHDDTANLGTYEFPGADPPVTVDGDVVVRPFTLTDFVPAVPTFPADVVTATTLFNVNLRAGPGLTFDIITTVPQDTTVGFTGFMDATGDWVQVDPAGGTPVGWIFASLLSNVPPGLEVRPADVTPAVTVANQPLGKDGTVMVPQVVAAQPGWIVIHADNDGAPGTVVGHAAVPAGTSKNVVVNVNTDAATETLYAMLHKDTANLGTYEFPGADPPVSVGGDVVVRPFTLLEFEEFPPTVVTATTLFNVNLRAGPGLTFDIIQTVPQGTAVGFTGFMDDTGNWVQVDPAGAPVGWMFASLLSNVPDDLAVAPAE